MNAVTAAEILRAATARLAAAGIDGAARDARRLLAHALGVAPDRLTLVLNDPVAPPQSAAFEAALDRRAARQPVSQIVGARAFFGRDFRVTRDTLDPRPETELVVEKALDHPFTRVLDLGTGSGAILLTLLAERPGATGIGTDNSDAALAVARGNAHALGLLDRAAFRRAHWFEGLDGRFDLIVSNPPYIAEGEMPSLAPEVRDWEPATALTDFGDGLSAYREIAARARARLEPGGRVIVEIGWRQGRAVSRLFRQAGFASVSVHRDLDGRDRVVVAVPRDGACRTGALMPK